MAELQTPTPAAPAAPDPSKAKAKKRRKKILRIIKSILTFLIVAAVIAGAAYAVWYFVFREKDDAAGGEPIFDVADIGSIVSKVDGYGSANAQSSESIVLTQEGVVEQLFVAQGQMVYEGDPLYVITSPKAEAALEAAREALVKAQEVYEGYEARLAEMEKELERIRGQRSSLTVTAPHPGKLMNVAHISVGEQHSAGEPIASIVDDTRLLLSLYYSYAYENDIHVGDTATVSVPVIMQTLTGTVEKINKVKMVSPEGGVNFEVVFVVDNIGTITEGMSASAAMVDAAGDPIYPYTDGTFTYYQTTTVSFKADGPVERLVDLINYAPVTKGQVLVVQGTDTWEEAVRTQQKAIDDYKETTMKAYQQELENRTKAVEDAEKGLLNFSATAPISGMVTALALYEGMEVSAGSTAIMIADNSVMTVNIQVDDRNRQYINVGDTLELSDWNGNYYMGVVDSMAVIGQNQNGVTVYPGIVKVDNPMGTLMGGYGLSYSFPAAQSLDCIVIPKGDVRYYSPEGSEEPQAVVYVKTDEDRDNMVEKSTLPKEMQQEIPAGCIVVTVETGLTDTYNVEIVSGLLEGDLVYNNTPKTDGMYWG